MRLKVLAPARVVLDQEADKITAMGPEGYFCLLPHHADFVSALAPGVLSLQGEDREISLAVDEGILVKCGNEVLVTTRNVFEDEAGGKIKPARALEMLALDADEAKCREIIAGLEAEFSRSFMPASEDLED